MGRWDDQHGVRYGGGGKKRNWLRIFRFVILGGFILLAVVMTAFFIPRAGLHVEIHDRSEVIGTVQTVAVRVTNNSFDTMRDVSVQFGEGRAHQIGDLGPFQARSITPDADELDFLTVTASANEGTVTTVKHRDPSAIVRNN